MENNTILKAEGLKMHFPIKKGQFGRVTGYVKAVDDLNINVYSGETLAVVGESGCGKSTLGRCIIRAHKPSDGKILFNSNSVGEVDMCTIDRQTHSVVRPEMQMIFQDPNSSLDPRMTVFNCIAEPFVINKKYKGDELKAQVENIADRVGLNVKHLNRYPHAFSGGQRQRIGIARALITQPRFIVADEPVSALDVSVQAQIINLLGELQDDFKLTYLFISHDLRVVHYISDRVMVMYLGRTVELCETRELYEHPLHPYTKILLGAIPLPDPNRTTKRVVLKGEIASPVNLPSGCAFHPRCDYCIDICKKETPKLTEVTPGRFCACHRAGEL